MEREVADVIKISVALVGLSLVLMVGAFVLYNGTSIMNDSTEVAMSLQQAMETSMLYSLASKGENIEMPKAALLNVIACEGEHISKILYVDGDVLKLLRPVKGGELAALGVGADYRYIYGAYNTTRDGYELTGVTCYSNMDDFLKSDLKGRVYVTVGVGVDNEYGNMIDVRLGSDITTLKGSYEIKVVKF